MAFDPVAGQIRLDAIIAARDSGALSVRHGETSTQFRSLEEMNEIIAKLERDIAAAATTPVVRQRLYYPWQSSKGL